MRQVGHVRNDVDDGSEGRIVFDGVNANYNEGFAIKEKSPSYY